MILAWAGALLIGLSLGVLGSGGSILTVPVLTYLVGQPEKVAIAGSLAIVGTISLFGGIPYARKSLVDYRSIVFFGIPGMAGAWIGAFLSQFVEGSTQIAVFAGLMLVAAILMLRPIAPDDAPRGKHRGGAKIAIDGLIVGCVTGFVGVGGGFLIVPALVLLGGLSMRRAVGTSLFIIALKSFTGFVKYLDVLEKLDQHLDWTILWTFSAIGILGSFAGNMASSRLPQQTLKRAFAVFLLVIGVMIIGRSWSELVGTTAAASAGH